MMIIRGTRLRNRIRDAPIGGDSPRLNHVVGTWNAVCMVIVCRLVEEFGELGTCWLNLTQFVRAPRLQYTLLSFPLPGHAKTRVRHPVYLASNLRASFQVWPPSVDISTLRTAPPPDQAKPVIW